MNTVDTKKNRMKEIGYQTENNRTQVRFDISDIMSEFPGGTAALLVLRPGDCEAFPAASTAMDGTSLVWTVTAYELAKGGHLKAQVIYTAGDTVAKTKIHTLIIGDSLAGDTEAPEDWEDWVGNLVKASGDVVAAIADAQDTLAQAVTDATSAKDGAVDAYNDAASAKTAAENARDRAESAEAGARFYEQEAMGAMVSAEDAKRIAVVSSESAQEYAIRAETAYANKGAPNGLAELDGTGKVPIEQLPLSLNDVREYQRKNSFPPTGESGIIYIALDTNKIYRYNTSSRTYAEIGREEYASDFDTRSIITGWEAST